MLFNEFSSSPLERLFGRFESKGMPSSATFFFEALFKGLQFSFIWGSAMWLLQWSVIDMSWQTAIAVSVVVGLASGFWMAAMNRRSKELAGEHRLGFQ
ncbi:hypothetical protein DN730_03250 [Marinomonas piezotolerans]|uniref:Uncharacterized protein n=1 Tax=Marinomonas piezotolerans TaxID=2213058 RepID=A0A370UE57_9GAMM|nr:DUF6404 family protein [Marinomonas piezotolerans]RDL46070.1 hypothetical protein DN730_03250 [Marinomonas piezotolerans]